MMAFFAGFLLDLLLGDPHWLPHPVRLIGRLVAWAEKCLLGKCKARCAERELWQGFLTVVIVLCTTGAAAVLILSAAYKINRCLGVIVETLMTYQILAAKSLKDESMKVYATLKRHDLQGARRALSMIVGRDTEELCEEGVIKAAVETVAENTSDGVIAPMIYMALGGPVLGFLYKAVNTMDSMIGYKNDKYLYFGRAAARLDDFMNFIPARISAYLMITASFLGRGFSGKAAYHIYKRDGKKHSSPNSAQTESVCAGALGIQFAGPAVYFGKEVKKPYIGDRTRAAEYEDIKRANHLMYITAWLGECLCLLVMGIIYGCILHGV